MLTLRRSLSIGSFGFCLTSVCVFATVAFAEGWMYRHLSVIGAYFIWTILFIGLGGTLLRPLVREVVPAAKFFTVFGIGFFMYAVGWMLAYFFVRGTFGEWLASLAGSVFLGLALAGGFGLWPLAPALCGLLFVTNSIGYFLGSALNSSVGDQMGMLLWGVAYGFSLGCGLGASFYLVQQRLDKTLPSDADLEIEAK